MLAMQHDADFRMYEVEIIYTSCPRHTADTTVEPTDMENGSKSTRVKRTERQC